VLSRRAYKSYPGRDLKRGFEFGKRPGRPSFGLVCRLFSVKTGDLRFPYGDGNDAKPVAVTRLASSRSVTERAKKRTGGRTTVDKFFGQSVPNRNLPRRTRAIYMCICACTVLIRKTRRHIIVWKRITSSALTNTGLCREQMKRRW